MEPELRAAMTEQLNQNVRLSEKLFQVVAVHDIPQQSDPRQAIWKIRILEG
jgi:hypothetical protein